MGQQWNSDILKASSTIPGVMEARKLFRMQTVDQSECKPLTKMTKPDSRSERREALVARRQRQKVEGAAAWADYQGEQQAALRRLLDLRKLRLARETNRTVK